jgi:hypothetical protein
MVVVARDVAVAAVLDVACFLFGCVVVCRKEKGARENKLLAEAAFRLEL